MQPRLIDAAVLREIMRFGEDGLFLRGIVEWIGYPNTTVEFESHERFSGKTKYNTRKMLKLAWEGVSSFSIVPLRIGVAVGLSASVLSLVFVAYAIASKLLSGGAVPGWTSTLAIVSFLFAILFLYLGLIGEYLGRALVEVRDRPRYLVRERLACAEQHDIDARAPFRTTGDTFDQIPDENRLISRF